MTKISDLSRYSLRTLLRTSMRLLGFAAAALLMLSIAGERAQALSLINPGAVATNKVAADGLTIEVRGAGSGGHGGYGGHSGFGGGVGYHSGSFHTGPAFAGGTHVGGHRFAHGRHVRRVFIGGVWYDYPYYDDYPYYEEYPVYSAAPGCRIVVTDDGPRQICNYRPWRHHYHRRHQRRHHRANR